MRKINNILIAFYLMLPLSICAQNVRYSECENCDNTLTNTFSGSMTIPTNGWGYQNIETLNDNPDRVSSDFGRREENSSWHIGLDFNPQVGNYDLGDILYPIETGTIERIWVSSAGYNYKYVQVSGAHHFSYGHIFFNGIPGDNGMQCGAFILKQLDNTDEDNYAIIYCPDDGDPITYGSVSGSTVTHPDLNDGLPIEITTTIESINDEEDIIYHTLNKAFGKKHIDYQTCNYPIDIHDDAN